VNDTVHNAADPQAVQRQKKKTKDQTQQQADDVRALLQLPEFRRYVWRHMNATCGLMRSAAHPNGSQQSLQIGMQSVGLQLWTEIEAVDPLMIPKMMTEYHESLK
jgi:hypothetical protein